MSLLCEPFQISNARSFWTTQPGACGTTESCDPLADCGAPGLSPNVSDTGVTIQTNDWVRSIALNMLLTNARRRDTKCGFVPGTMNGHWSESFMAQGQAVGSHVRYSSPQASVRDSMLLIKAEVQTTLQKLIDYGIAIEVTVETKYIGSGKIFMDIVILGTSNDPTKIGMTAQKSENSWVWGI